MSLAQFGVVRILRYVMMNKKIKSKREIFMLIDLLLQASLVGNILIGVMLITRDITVKNYIILLIASIAAGLFASFIDTNKIFGRGSNVKLSKPEPNDGKWMTFYFIFIGIYVVLSVVFGFMLIR